VEWSGVECEGLGKGGNLGVEEIKKAGIQELLWGTAT